MKRLKIGLIVPGFSADESNWGIPVLLNTVRKLAAQHEVHVFALRHPPQPRTYTVYGATVHALGGGTLAGLHRMGLLARAMKAITTAAQSTPFDVLHGLWADEPGFAAIVAGRWLRVPVIVSLMGGEIVKIPQIDYGHQLSRSARRMIAWSLRLADQITVGSGSLAALTERTTGRRPILTPLGVDTAHFSPGESGILTGEFKLLNVASLIPIKNHSTLLHALGEVRRHVPNIHLHIVGDGTLRSELERLTRSLEIEASVTFHGKISHDHLPAYYRAADLCVLTSHYESQGMVALEAAACGCVTIGADVGLLPELVLREHLASSGDVAGLARIITELAINHDLRHQLNHRAFQLTLENFTLDQAITRWLTLYEQQATRSTQPTSRTD
jgi:glycosyltransferase involved in cell wall biosynthesis